MKTLRLPRSGTAATHREASRSLRARIGRSLLWPLVFLVMLSRPLAPAEDCPGGPGDPGASVETCSGSVGLSKCGQPEFTQSAPPLRRVYRKQTTHFASSSTSSNYFAAPYEGYSDTPCPNDGPDSHFYWNDYTSTYYDDFSQEVTLVEEVARGTCHYTAVFSGTNSDSSIQTSTGVLETYPCDSSCQPSWLGPATQVITVSGVIQSSPDDAWACESFPYVWAYDSQFQIHATGVTNTTCQGDWDSPYDYAETNSYTACVSLGCDTPLTVDSPTQMSYSASGGGQTASKIVTLTEEYTDADLIADLNTLAQDACGEWTAGADVGASLTWTEAWIEPFEWWYGFCGPDCAEPCYTGVLIYFPAEAHVSAVATGSKYRIKVPQTVKNGNYVLTWNEVTTLPDGTVKRKAMREHVKGTGDPANPVYTAVHSIPVPLVECTIKPADIQITVASVTPPGSGGTDVQRSAAGTSGCATCSSAPATGGREDGPSFSMSLGSAGMGEPAGTLGFSISDPDWAVYSPASLLLSDQRPDVQVLSPEGYFRQIRAPQMLADILVNGANGYSICCWYLADVSATLGADGLYATNIGGSSQPFAVWTIENTDPNTANQIRISETRSGTLTGQWNWTWADNTWKMQPLNTGIEKSIARTVNPDQTVTVTTTWRPVNGADVQRVERTYKQFSWGEALIRESWGSAAAPRTTTYTYDTAYGVYGRVPLLTATRPDGSWVQYADLDYYSRPGTLYHAQRDNAIGSSTRYTTYSYMPWQAGISASDDDDTLWPDSPRMIQEFEDGQEVSRQYLVYRSVAEQIHVQCTASPGAAWTDPSNLFTTNRYYTSGPNQFALKCVTHPDLTITTYDYVDNESGTAHTNVTAGGRPDPTFTFVIDGVSNRMVTSRWGYPISEESYDVATGILLSRDIHDQPDGFARPQRVTHLDGTTELVQYDCCGLASSTDRDGVVTTYLYDLAHRPIGYIRSGITYSNVLDAAGRALQSIRVGTDGSRITNSISVHDLAGRLLTQSNALGGETTYTEGSDPVTGALTRTTTNPDGGTTIETYYLDGSLKKTTGTAVHGTQHSSGAVWDDDASSYLRYSRETKLLANGSPSSEWTETRTDAAGRVFKTLYADSSAAPSEFSYYNAQGQLWKQVDPDGVTRLFVYNRKGEQVYSIEALSATALGFQDYTALSNGLGGLLSGTDRITASIADVTSSHGWNVRRARSYVWAANGSGASNLVSVAESSMDGLISWQTSYRGDVVFVLSSNRTVFSGSYRYSTNIAPDGSYTVATYNAGRLTSSVHKDALNTQLSSTTYAYDAHGRQNTATDARNGATTTTFNNADLVASVTTPRPATGAVPQTTLTYYSQMLQATNIVQPDGSAVISEYYPTGELKRQYGSRTYPLGYGYDYAGRMALMTNWTGFASGAGTRVTTWNYHPYRGWLTSKQYADGNGPTYTYTPGGRLSTRTWARGVITAYTYGVTATGSGSADLIGVAYSNDPQNTPGLTYTYDRLGRQATVLQNGMTTASAYNLAGQVLTETYSGGTLAGLSVTNGYDHLMRRTNLVSLLNNVPLTSATNTYDAASRLAIISDGTNSATYVYLANSPLVSQITFKQNATTRMTTTKQYDFLDRLTSISSAFGSSAIGYSYVYNNANQRVRRTDADQSYWAYDYDPLGQVTRGAHYWPDQSPIAGQQFHYAFDDIGNRTQTKAGGDQNGANLRVAAYSADNLNRYTSRQIPAAVDVMGVGFATNAVLVNGLTAYRKGEYFRQEIALVNSNTPAWQSISVTESNQAPVSGNLFVPQTPEQFGYDLDGNLTSDGRWNYTWNAENRLVALAARTSVGPQNSLRFEYDAQGRRIRKQVWSNTAWSGNPTNDARFIYDGWNLMASLNPQLQPLNSCVWGLDLSGSQQGAGGVGGMVVFTDATGGASFQAFDGNGNVAAVVKAADGTSSATYEYGPFGETTRATGPMARANPIRFSTKYQDDETDLVYYPPGRSYSPIWGGWLGRDPIEEDGGPNLCAFVDNDGVNHVDPFGLWRIGRYGQPRATAFADPGDTIRGLAVLIKLNPDEYKKWLNPWVVVTKPYSLDTPLSSCDLFTIPNTAYIDYDVGYAWPGFKMQYFRRWLRHRWESQGYYVDVSRWTMGRDLVLAHLNDPNIYLYAYIGHGVGGAIQPDGENLDSGKYTPFGIRSMLLVACDTDREWFWWRPNVSQAGQLLTCFGPITLFHWDWRIH